MTPEQMRGRPRAEPAVPVDGLIHQADHAMPVQPLRISDGGIASTAPEAGDRSEPPHPLVAVDAIELGADGSGQLSRRAGRLVGAAVAVLLVAAACIGLVQIRDERQTVDQEQFLTAMRTFGTGIHPADVTVQDPDELGRDITVSDPAECHIVLDVGSVGSLGAASWSPSDESGFTDNVQAARYVDPASARKAFAALRDAARRCHHAVLPETSDQTGGQLAVTDVDTGMGPTGRRLRYTVRVDDPVTVAARASSAEFSVDVLRYGNVMVWTFGRSAAQAHGTDQIAALVSRMQALRK